MYQEDMGGAALTVDNFQEELDKYIFKMAEEAEAKQASALATKEADEAEKLALETKKENIGVQDELADKMKDTTKSIDDTADKAKKLDDNLSTINSKKYKAKLDVDVATAKDVASQLQSTLSSIDNTINSTAGLIGSSIPTFYDKDEVDFFQALSIERRQTEIYNQETKYRESAMKNQQDLQRITAEGLKSELLSIP